MIPTSIDGTDITGATIDGTDVTEITVDGQTVFSAGPPPAPVNRMYVANANVIVQYDLTNKFDLTGATQNGTFSSFGQLRDISITDSGNKMVVSAYSDGRHDMYNLSTPYDITSAGNSTSTLSEFDAHGNAIDPSGTHLLTGTDRDLSINYYTLSTPYDLSSASFQDSVNTGNPFDVDYVNQGEYVFGVSNQYQVNRWELSTPYDFTTRSNKQTYSIPDKYRAIHITDDGLKYFAGDFGTDSIFEYNLSTGYDISTRGSIVDTVGPEFCLGLELV